MSNSVVTVDICLCTYKRDALLKQCLDSLLAQEVGDINYRIIVVDNDELMSAKRVVDHVKESTNIPIVYASEKRKNIAHARNLCLEQVKAEYICFIDDDEVASPTWLNNLYRTLTKYRVDIVVGPVIATYPKYTPDWVIKSGIFERNIKDTGEKVTAVATNNCMVKRSVITAGNLIFDESYGLSGGEDSKFFYELFLTGARAVYCQDAKVYEEAEKSRMSISYFIKRSLRGGQTYSSIRLSNLSKQQKAKTICIKVLHVILASLMTLITLPLGKHIFIKWVIKTASSIGQIQGLFNKRINLY